MLPIVDAAAGIMTGVIKPILDKFVLDEKDRVDAEQFAAKQIQDINLAQIEVNKIEASSGRLFISGWRPFVGWVCGGGFAYAVIVRDVLTWFLTAVSVVSGYAVPPLPEVNTTILAEVLFALLGFGGLRTYEKLNNVAKS